MSTNTRTRKATPATPAVKETPAKAAAPAPAPKPAPANCACGCGKPTVTAKALFLSGHDARHAGVVGRGLALDDAKAKAAFEALSPNLQKKARSIEATARRKAVEKAAKEAARKAAKEAYAKALATA